MLHLPLLDWSGLIVPDDYYKAFRHRGLGGACFSPAVSRGGSVAFLAQKQDGYAADKNEFLSSQSTTTTGLNLAHFAEHGYVVVAPNVSGSIGYGEDFVNATEYHFASAAYEDLEHGSRYLEKEVSYIDTRRSVALGCGYGGCMISWIQGHDLGRRFRALVSCNGIVSIMSYLSTDVQRAIFHELGGPPWDSPEEWRRSDPAQHLHNWSTPQLVIHDAAHMHFPVSDAVYEGTA
ncbi:Alpha/Beta hydrolase protein [Aspergillus nidulans var. acristatus]